MPERKMMYPLNNLIALQIMEAPKSSQKNHSMQIATEYDILAIFPIKTYAYKLCTFLISPSNVWRF